MGSGCGGQKPVYDGQSVRHVQVAPLFRDSCVDWQDASLMAGDDLLEPSVKALSPSRVPASKRLDPPPDLAENDHAEEDLVWLEKLEPFPNGRVSPWALPQFGEDVGVDEVRHS